MVPDPHFQSTEPSAPQPTGSILKSARRDTVTDHQGGRRHGESIGAMGKRVDFSLGMSSISSGDQFGDVFDDPVKPRLPSVHQARMSSPPASRGSEDDSSSLAHTTSRDSAGNKTHRNRFFSRTRSKMEHGRESGVSLEDLEEGRSGRDGFTAYDMPDIPEASGANSAKPVVGVTPPDMAHMQRVGTGFGGRMDPRTGIVSPQAVARDSALERGDLPLSFQASSREGSGGRHPEMR